MKIAYIAYENFSKPSGVSKKILNQIKIWREQGHTVRLFLISNSIEMYQEAKDTGIIDIIYSGKGLKKIFSLDLRTIIRWNPDVIYLRFCIYFPSLKSILTKYPVIVETNTNDLEEYRITLSKIKYIYHKLTRKNILSKCSGFVHVTNELRKIYDPFNKPSIVLGNGIDLSKYGEAMNHEIPENEYNLLFIGSPGMPWHGIDKIVKMAQQIPEFNFHIIGYESLPEELGKPENVFLYGYINTDDCRDIMSKCDVAIGSLALHRNRMYEGSPLKVREYLALGLPVIIGYLDTDFPKETDFILVLENAENNIDHSIEKIKDFVKGWKGKRVERDQIRHLDTAQKELRRLDFFQDILRRRGL
jgi:hypothetical protein